MTAQESAVDTAVMAGGWTPYRPVTAADLHVFMEATEGMVGVTYIPHEVATQVVAGTNYRFRCQTRQLHATGAIVGTATVQIYQPLQGQPEITRIDAQAPADALMGGWSDFEAPTTQEIALFDSVMGNMVGVRYTPVNVSTQLVSGTNYRFQCTTSLPMAGGDIEGSAMVEIYQPLEGDPVLVSITTPDVMAGGWTSYREPSAEEVAMFSEVVPTALGFGYVPVKVSTQVVAGINYRFLAERNILLPAGFPAQPMTLIEIFQSLDGKPHLVGIYPSND
ncbi:MAG: hypothetical protein OIF57_17560 [Marinobacterium sp.]|nr:hypothetical protein [Marinobacterium sp.]